MDSLHALHSQLTNALTRERDENDRALIRLRFPELATAKEPHYLVMRRYLKSCPERFFDDISYHLFLDWLRRRSALESSLLKKYLLDHDREMNHALLNLRDINAEDWHDDEFPSDELASIRLIDSNLHRAYLRLIEAVLYPLIRPIAYFSRLDSGRGTEDLKIYNVVQEITRSTESRLTANYHQIVRNGIGHGDVTYLQKEIRYRDNKGNEYKATTFEVVRMFDDLLDTCNGIAAALRVFLISSRGDGYRIPREFLIDELQEETSAPWWTVEGSVESELAGMRQLMIYVRPETRDYPKVQWSAVQTAILAEFFAPGYERYFLTLRSRRGRNGWAGFDGKLMKKLREARVDDISGYAGISEDGVIFFAPGLKLPNFVRKIGTLLLAFKINWPIAKQQIRSNLDIPVIVCRAARVHRNSWGAVVRGEVVLDGLASETAKSMVRKQRRRIVRHAIKEARRSSNGRWASYLPVGFAQISIYRRDYRARRLSGFGLDEDLVCTLRLHRIRRIKSPDIMGSTVENNGKWRIAWNKAWLDASQLEEENANGAIS